MVSFVTSISFAMQKLSYVVSAYYWKIRIKFNLLGTQFTIGMNDISHHSMVVPSFLSLQASSIMI